MNTSSNFRKRGITMLEMIFDATLSMMLVVGVTGAMGQSRRVAGAAAQRAKLALLATGELDRLRSLPPESIEDALGRREVPDGAVVFVLESATRPHRSGMRVLTVAATSVEPDPPAPVALATLVPEVQP